jgi:hypothetical protein
MYIVNKTYRGRCMRIGINIPNELYNQFKPLKATYNLSQVCRDALMSLVESYENGLKQAKSDGMEALVNRFFQEHSKKPILDWEAIGRENARKWAEGASLEDFEELYQNIQEHRRGGHEPGESLGSWRNAPENRFEVTQQQHDDWFEWQFNLDSTINHYAIARNDYNRGWISYLTAVWQMLQERIEAAKAERLKALQQTYKPEIPKELDNNIKSIPHTLSNSKKKRGEKK